MSVEALAGCLGVSFALVPMEAGRGFAVQLGAERRRFERFGEAVLFVAPWGRPGGRRQRGGLSAAGVN